MDSLSGDLIPPLASSWVLPESSICLLEWTWWPLPTWSIVSHVCPDWPGPVWPLRPALSHSQTWPGTDREMTCYTAKNLPTLYALTDPWPIYWFTSLQIRSWRNVRAWASRWQHWTCAMGALFLFICMESIRRGKYSPQDIFYIGSHVFLEIDLTFNTSERIWCKTLNSQGEGLYFPSFNTAMAVKCLSTLTSVYCSMHYDLTTLHSFFPSLIKKHLSTRFLEGYLGIKMSKTMSLPSRDSALSSQSPTE